jgi:hypothetical protein
MFNIQSVRDLQWADAAHTKFDCWVKYEQFDEEHPTTVDPNDNYEHQQELWKNGLAGEYGEIAEYVEPSPPAPIDVPMSLEDLLKTL